MLYPPVLIEHELQLTLSPELDSIKSSLDLSRRFLVPDQATMMVLDDVSSVELTADAEIPVIVDILCCGHCPS